MSMNKLKEKTMRFPEDFIECVFRFKTSNNEFFVGPLRKAEKDFLILESKGKQIKLNYSDIESFIVYYPFHSAEDYIIYYPYKTKQESFWINKKLEFGSNIVLFVREDEEKLQK